MLNRENKTAMTRKGMVSNRLNKFSIRKYTVGTASILVGTTLIFGLGSQEAKAAEVTNKEMKEDATSVNNDQVSKKVDTEQLNNDGNTSKVDTEQLKDENINKVANQKEVTRVENSVASEKNNNSKPSENGKLQTSDVKKTEDNNATSDDQVTTTVNSQQLNTDNTTSMSSAPINVRKDDLKFNNEEVRNVGEKSDNTDNANSSELIKPKTTEPKRLNTRMRIAAIQPNSTDSKNVNDLITSNTTLTVVDADNSKTIVPAQDYLSLKSQITVDDKVKSGDYFTIKYSDTVQVYGLNPEDIKNIGDIKDPNNGETIATAKHDTANNLITYTFTDYVDRFNSVQMGINYSIYMDADTIPVDKKDVPFSVTIGNQTTTTTADITYPAYKEADNNSIGSAFTETVSHAGNAEDPGYYNQVVYVNPMDKDLKGANLKVEAYHPKYPANIGQINQNVTNIKIYRVPEGYTLNKGYDVNANDLVDVTDEFKNKMAYGTNQSVNIDFGDITSAYVVMVKTKFQYTNSESPTLVQMATLTSDGNRSVSTGNALGFTNNQSGGAGQEVYKIGNYVWEDTNKNGVQDKDEKGISGVTVTLKDENDKVLKTVTTDENGKYQFTDLNNGTYKVEFETPSGYTPTSVTSGNDTEKDSNGLTTTGVIKDADNMTLDSGFYKTPKYSLGDYVWYDSNKDGKQDSTEKGIKGVKVTLLNEKGEVIGTTKTDENGKYRFDNLDSGKYKV
ncbi:TPA: fibrinogen-binding adhesin SdrG C-terminal domain-containing protein, partial [Staphylococcus aureus]|nr:fibrinogen-binding adhesin SdrG C-terminal domain-containing protein [Staphylococcus aureus]